MKVLHRLFLQQFQMSRQIILTTNSDIPKHTIEESLEIVTGTACAQLGSYFTPDTSLSVFDKTTQLKNEVLSQMRQQAVVLGADAVVGVTFQRLNKPRMEMFASGTAVRISKC
jgi:uncharacterized protein YbjQ (UPF0145 family)